MFRMIPLRIVIKQIDMADRLDRIIHEAFLNANFLFTGPRHFPGSLLDTHRKVLRRLGSSGNSSAALSAHSHDRPLNRIIHLKEIVVRDGVRKHSSEIIAMRKQARRPLAHLFADAADAEQCFLHLFSVRFYAVSFQTAEFKKRYRPDLLIRLRQHLLKFIHDLLIQVARLVPVEECADILCRYLNIKICYLHLSVSCPR